MSSSRLGASQASGLAGRFFFSLGFRVPSHWFATGHGTPALRSRILFFPYYAIAWDAASMKTKL